MSRYFPRAPRSRPLLPLGSSSMGRGSRCTEAAFECPSFMREVNAMKYKITKCRRSTSAVPVPDVLSRCRRAQIYLLASTISSFGSACDGKLCVRRDITPTPKFFLFFFSFSPGVNSFVTRAIKKMVTSTKKQGNEIELFIVGEKGRSQLARIYADVSSTAAAAIAIHRYTFLWSGRRPSAWLHLPGRMLHQQ